MSANDKTTVGSGRGNWRTPETLWRPLHDRHAFDYDAASDYANRLPFAEWHSTTEGTYAYRGDRVSVSTGLEYPWAGRRVFINPPYGDPLAACPRNVTRLRCDDCGGLLAQTGTGTVECSGGIVRVWARHADPADAECANYSNSCPPQRTSIECKRKRCHALGHPDTYTAGIADFARKCAEERNSAAIIVGVLPDARDTAWWRESVAPFADDYPIGRVRFIDPDTGTPGDSPPGGTAIVVWRPDWLRRG